MPNLCNPCYNGIVPQDDFRKLLRRATQEGAAASDLQAAIQQGQPQPPSEALAGSGLYHELLNLRLSREELESAFAAEHAEQAKEEEERRRREQELVGECLAWRRRRVWLHVLL